MQVEGGDLVARAGALLLPRGPRRSHGFDLMIALIPVVVEPLVTLIWDIATQDRGVFVRI